MSEPLSAHPYHCFKMATIRRSSRHELASPSDHQQPREQQHRHHQYPPSKDGPRQMESRHLETNHGPLTAAITDNSARSIMYTHFFDTASHIFSSDRGLSCETAPRLSTSSVESGSASELATPENGHQPWPYPTNQPQHHDDRIDLPLSQSPQSLTMDLDANQSQQLDYCLRNDKNCIVSSAAERCLSTLTRFQRPAKLERLSSTITNTTARPSPPLSASISPSKTTPTSAHMDRGLLDMSSLQLASIFSSAEQPMVAVSPSFDSGSRYHSPAGESIEWDEHETTAIQNEHRCRFDSGMSARESLASPDSWRSLLPEHDPYFAPESQNLTDLSNQPSSPKEDMVMARGGTRSPYGSDSGYAPSRQGFASFAHDRGSIASFDTGRTSFSSTLSQYSSVSLPGATTANPICNASSVPESDSWRSLLPDSDRYHAARAAGVRVFAPRNSNSNASGPDHLESLGSFQESNPRAAFFPLHTISSSGHTSASKEVSSKRHASFSSYDPNRLSDRLDSATNMLGKATDCRDTMDGPVSELAAKRFAKDSTLVARRSETTRQSSAVSSAARNLAPSLSALLFERDMHGREAWPTSRGRSSSSVTTASGPMANSCTEKLASPLSPSGSSFETRGGLGSPPSSSLESGFVAKTTSDSTTGSVLDASSTTATDATVTSTASTATARGTTAGWMHTSPPNGPAPIETVGDSSAQPDSSVDEQNFLKARSPSCSVSTPMSPPSLPFLDRRPAPPETELVIETSKTTYTLVTRLPGFSLDCITLATKHHRHHRTLHIVADKWDAEGGGHFERRITFPEKECDLKNVRAEFDGTILRVFVPRRTCPTRFSSASSATF